MRFLPRLHACAAGTIIFVLYLSWVRPTLHIQARLRNVWNGNSHRLVVFGDDWSDTREYRVSPPPKTTTRDRDPDQGRCWTEVFCAELACDFIDNFARSLPENLKIASVGSVVDSNIYASAKSRAGKRNATLVLFDFEAQVQQFLDYDKNKGFIPMRFQRRLNESTIFTVFFGLWDLLEYSDLDQDDAVHAIDRSIERLFRILGLLADHVSEPIKVVLPSIMDVTWLPLYQSKKNDSASIFAQDQRQTVFLWTYWNTALFHSAAEWDRGDLYLPNLNNIVMNQVRAQQLASKHISDASGFGKSVPLFDEVNRPCLSLRADNGNLRATHVEKCDDPARHLFWDNMHLSGPAHQLIGEEAARLLRENRSINIDNRRRVRLPNRMTRSLPQA